MSRRACLDGSRQPLHSLGLLTIVGGLVAAVTPPRGDPPASWEETFVLAAPSEALAILTAACQGCSLRMICPWPSFNSTTAA